MHFLLQGQAAKICNPGITNDIEVDYASVSSAFGTDVANKHLYNGNIANAVYSIGTLGLRGYQYKYDQLQRLKAVTNYTGADEVNNTWNGSSLSTRYGSSYAYDANGNITDLVREGNGTAMDDMDYMYANGKNQLNHVDDNPAYNANYTDDIDDQAVNNYAYTAIGELKQDTQGEIQDIEWRVDGKIKKITRTSTSNKPQVEFEYDAFGRRVLKLVKPTTLGVPHASNTWVYTYYVRDQGGNLMATYEVKQSGSIKTFELEEFGIYGASRLGELTINEELTYYFTSTGSVVQFTLNSSQRKLGNKNYALHNQVDNVLVTVSDRFVPHNNSGTIDYFTAQITSESDYYPFGQLQPGRNNNATTYKFGFQDQLKDDEIYGSTNSLVSAEYWEYDTRLGRRWNEDPFTRTHQSPYAAFSNNPIINVDPSGAIDWCSVVDAFNSMKSFIGKHPEMGMLKAAGGGGAGNSSMASSMAASGVKGAIKPGGYVQTNSETTNDQISETKRRTGMAENYAKIKSRLEYDAYIGQVQKAIEQSQTSIGDATSDAQKMANYNLDVAKDFVPGANLAIKLARGEKVTAQDWIIEAISIIPVVKIGGVVFKGVLRGTSALTKIGGFATEKLLNSHFARHASEFNGLYKNADEYLKGAQDFFKQTNDDIFEYIRTNGDVVRYDKMNNVFGVAQGDGTIRTFFKPKDGLDYFKGEVIKDLGVDAANLIK